jgi:hypothetical protein
MGAAKDAVIRLDPMPDHPAAAVLADRGEGVHRALEAVEDLGLIAAANLERLVVLVAADLTVATALLPVGRGRLRDLRDRLADLLLLRLERDVRLREHPARRSRMLRRIQPYRMTACPRAGASRGRLQGGLTWLISVCARKFCHNAATSDSSEG